MQLFQIFFGLFIIKILHEKYVTYPNFRPSRPTSTPDR